MFRAKAMTVLPNPSRNYSGDWGKSGWPSEPGAHRNRLVCLPALPVLAPAGQSGGFRGAYSKGALAARENVALVLTLCLLQERQSDAAVRHGHVTQSMAL
ncbi:hypothetical protein IscW_ISCW021063 [Ixodes scapularis]|uniref:Uncharacterized protein n=1 Tax=Ixodes scapularis TaxID=6945 RepID=B7Q9X8_IXOSC|nr:hypothetical protein IscW_ISCW021063 [Ixodes scapularis]|eukprot:XP_002406400.1 hypothetical protein IscW_ISCW021063 [Ixodes scapularis]